MMGFHFVEFETFTIFYQDCLNLFRFLKSEMKRKDIKESKVEL